MLEENSWYQKILKLGTIIISLYTLKNYISSYRSYNDICLLDLEEGIKGTQNFLKLPIKKIEINSNMNALIYDSSVGGNIYRIFFNDYNNFERKIENILNTTTRIYHIQDFSWFTFILNKIPVIFLLYLAIRVYAMRENILKSDEKLIKEKSDVKLEDVKGLFETKEEVLELVNIMINPEKFKNLGTKVPSGILMEGSTGTGKTMLAKAIANHYKASFYYISGSEFIQTFVGLGVEKVKNLFREARENSPSIIFIDEIDAIGKSRSNSSINSHEERENTLNALLVEMDGFNTSSGVLIIGATNRADILDKALKRPGRFDRIISFSLPNIEERKDILKYYIEKQPVEETLEKKIETFINKLAISSYGFNNAELYNICNEASINAGLENREFITKRDYEKAYEYILMGKEKKSNKLSEEEREIVAHHEAGHALLSLILENVENPTKVTIIPHSKGSLGFSQSIPEREKKLYNKKELLDQMKVLLGGRVAEEIIFNEITSGASDDLQKLKNIAYNYVAKYGMSENLSCITYDENKTSEYLWQKIDESIENLIKELEKETKKLLEENIKSLKRIAEELLEKETIYLKDIKECVRKD